MSVGREGQMLFFNPHRIRRLPGEMLPAVNRNGDAGNALRAGKISHGFGNIARPRPMPERQCCRLRRKRLFVLPGRRQRRSRRYRIDPHDGSQRLRQRGGR